MVIPLLLLVRNIDCDQVCVLHVSHLGLLLLESRLRLLLAMIKTALRLLPLVLDLLADTVIFAFDLLQVPIAAISFLLQLGRVICVGLAQVLVLGRQMLQWFGDLSDQGIRKAFVLRSSALEGGELDGPRGHRRTLQRARSRGGSVAHAQAARLARFLLIVFLSQGIQLLAVFLLNGVSLAVELLNVAEPGDAAGDPRINGLEAILQFRTKARRDLYFGHGDLSCSRSVITKSSRQQKYNSGSQQHIKAQSLVRRTRSQCQD